MPQYMLSVHTADQPREPMTHEQQREGFARIASVEADMEAAGAFLFSARLSDAAAAKVVRRRGPGRPTPTDGPFAETKEMLGGFYLIEAPDIEAAVQWASLVSEAIDEPIEVRPLAGSRSR